MGLDINHSKPTLKTESTLDYFTIEELKGNQNLIELHRHLIAQIEGEDGGSVEVIFFVNIGFQRKQMNEHFIRDFKNGEAYFDINTVKKATSYLKATDKNDQTELIQIFQRDFIDNFTEGESIFWASW
jgi:GMP synthase PP-ATPase subunit